MTRQLTHLRKYDLLTSQNRLQKIENCSHFWPKCSKMGLRRAPELSFCVPRSVRPSGTDFWDPKGLGWTKMGQCRPPNFPKLANRSNYLSQLTSHLKCTPGSFLRRAFLRHSFLGHMAVHIKRTSNAHQPYIKRTSTAHQLWWCQTGHWTNATARKFFTK